MTHTLRGILALLLVTLVWGTTFPAMKALTEHFSAQWIIFIRFAIAGLLLSPFLWKPSRDDLVSGGLLGVLLFFCFVFQVEGLALTTSNRNAFICGLSVLFVPLLDLLAGKLPEKRIVLAMLLAVAGLALLCWDGGAWGTRRHLRPGQRHHLRPLHQDDGLPHPPRLAPDDPDGHPDPHRGPVRGHLAAGARSAPHHHRREPGFRQLLGVHRPGPGQVHRQPGVSGRGRHGRHHFPAKLGPGPRHGQRGGRHLLVRTCRRRLLRLLPAE